MMVRLAGKAEMGAGDRSEPQSPTDALAHHQESETAFKKALDLKKPAEEISGLVKRKETPPSLTRVSGYPRPQRRYSVGERQERVPSLRDMTEAESEA